ncbi:ArnT family glycosyltransferase [Nanoarchaeota archaeon]
MKELEWESRGDRKYFYRLNYLNKMKKKHIFILAGLILVLMFLLRFFPLRLIHWWDETVYLQHAEIMFSGRTNFSELAFRPPLLSIFFFLGFFIKHSVVIASIITAFLGVLVPVVIFLIGKKIYDFKVGLIGALISGFLPFLIRNSNYLLTDIPVIAFMGFSFYFALFKGKKNFLFLSGIFFGLAVLMKFTAILLFLIIIVYLFFNKESWKNLFIFCFGISLILIPYFIWCFFQFGNPLNPFIVGPSLVADKNESLFFYFSNFIEAFNYIVGIGLIFWIINLIINLKRKKKIFLKEEYFLLFWIFLFLIYLTKVPHKELRYILPITIPIILLASRGWILVVDFFKKYKIIFLIIFLIYLVFLINPRIDYIKQTGFIDYEITDEIRVANYLKEINYSGTIYSNQRWPVLAYYTNLKTIPLFPNNEEIYNLLPDLINDSGFVIGMHNVSLNVHPRPEIIDNDKRFKKIADIGNFFIYEYTSY